VSVVNALSTRLDVEVRRQGYHWRMSFQDGVPTGPLERGEPTDATGTTVTHWANADIFETVEYDAETLRSRFQQMAFLNKGLQLTLVDERKAHVSDDTDDVDAGDRGDAPVESRTTYKYDDGLVDYVKHLNSSKKSDPVHDEILAFEAEAEDKHISVEIAMQWTLAYSESVHTYANTINTHEGGTHEEGFRAALTSLVGRYARDNNMLKKDEQITGDDIREGLTAVISVKLAEPQFEGQTKTKLGNTEARGYVQKVLATPSATGSPATPARPATSSARRSRLRPPVSPPGGRARPPVARACWSPTRCPASSRTASPATRRAARSTSSRATRRGARPSTAAIPRPRRSSRSGARSSTSRRRAWTGRWAARRSRRSSPPSAPGSARTSTSPS
jgi:hypothetical protein